MFLKKYNLFFIVSCFFMKTHMSAMQHPFNLSNFKLQLNELEIRLKALDLELKKIELKEKNKIQENFKEICFGFIDNKTYSFKKSSFETIELAGYLIKIINFLIQTNFSLLENLYQCCSIKCSCNSLQDNKSDCLACGNIYKSICKKLKNSENKAIKALKEIKYCDRVMLSEEGLIPKESKELIRKVVEILSASSILETDSVQVYDDN